MITFKRERDRGVFLVGGRRGEVLVEVGVCL